MVADEGNEGDTKVAAEIFSDVRFEQLEAQGRADFAHQQQALPLRIVRRR